MILMVQDEHILGLLVERVTGVFFCTQSAINRIVVEDPIHGPKRGLLSADGTSVDSDWLVNS